MSYNNGKSLDVNEITDIEKAIYDFSEGNTYLQKLLLQCYRNNIKTIACCTGHEESNNLPYVAFLYSKDNKQFIYYLLSELKDSGLEFRYNKNSVLNPYFYLGFKNYDYKCFHIISDLLNKFDKTKDYYFDLPIDLQNYFNIINTISDFGFVKSDNNVKSSYFQFGYEKEGDLYNYFSFSDNYDCISLLIESGFKINNQENFGLYYIQSNERNKNNEVLENMCSNLDKKLNKLTIPNDIMNKDFNELNIHFQYQDNDRNIDFIKCNLGDTINDIAIKLALCKVKGISAYTILNGIEVNNYNTSDPTEIRNNYFEQLNSRNIKR